MSTTESLSLRNNYLAATGAYITSCHTKWRSLVASFGWGAGSFNRNSQFNVDQIQVTSSVPASEATESRDYEKLCNDLVQWKKTGGSEVKSLVQLLETERNLKRRRISYKNKVHTKNKSHTEVLRELVREQMFILEVMGATKDAEEPAEGASGDRKSEGGLIQLGYSRGHPYKLWQQIGRMVDGEDISKSAVPADSKSGTICQERGIQTAHSHYDNQKNRPRSSTGEELHDSHRRLSKKHKNKDKKSSRSSHKHKRKRRSRSKS